MILKFLESKRKYGCYNGRYHLIGQGSAAYIYEKAERIPGFYTDVSTRCLFLTGRV